MDLHPLRLAGDIAFPVIEGVKGSEPFEFEARAVRPNAYTDLLPEALRAGAPRAFDTMGDIAIVKVPQDLWDHQAELGDAIQRFLGARAVFHDRGVQGEFRVRDLERIAGDGGPATSVQENGVTLHVDVGRAYFSPRLASERARVAAMVQDGEHLVDLFGGVAPLAVQAAKLGARVTCVDLNPDACELAHRNAKTNKVEVDVRCGDARAVAKGLDPADRVVLNLPHGAKHFLDVAKALVKPGGMVHHHEILADREVDRRADSVATELAGRVAAKRHVRNYSAEESHWVFDIRIDGGDQ